MPLDDFHSINSDGQILGAELRRLARETVAQDKLTGSGQSGGSTPSTGIITARRNGAGFQLGIDLPLSFWAEITSVGSGPPTPHAWSQLQENADGTLSTDAEGRTGTTTSWPAYALDGGTVTVGTMVRLFQALGGEYFLFAGSSNNTPTIFSAGKIGNASSISLTAGPAGLITWDTAIFDTGGFWNPLTPTQLNLASDTYYSIGAQLSIPADAIFLQQVLFQIQDDTGQIPCEAQFTIPIASPTAWDVNVNGIFKTAALGTRYAVATIAVSQNTTLAGGTGYFWAYKIG